MLKKEKRPLLLLASVLLITVFWGVLLHSERTEAYNNTIPISALSGTWTVRDGSGSGTIDGNPFNLKIRSGSIKISNIHIDHDGLGGLCDVSSRLVWEVFDSHWIKLLEFPVSSSLESVYYKNTGDNQYSSTSHVETIVITLLSKNSGMITDNIPADTEIEEHLVSATLTYYVDKGSKSGSGGGCSTGTGLAGMFALLAVSCFRRKMK